MNQNENLNMLIEALEHGDYVQMRYGLRGEHDLDDREDQYAYCIWGVGCELYRQSNPETSKWSDATHSFCILVNEEHEHSFKNDIHVIQSPNDENWAFYSENPPIEVMNFFGLSDHYIGMLIDLNDEKQESFSCMAKCLKSIRDHDSMVPVLEGRL